MTLGVESNLLARSNHSLELYVATPTLLWSNEVCIDLKGREALLLRA